MQKKKGILFACTYNSVRSQMAEGWAKKMFPKSWEIFSAGAFSSGVNPLAVKVMQEVDIDISGQHSKDFSGIPLEAINIVVTLCGDARDNCPVFPNMEHVEHWPLPDPAQMEGPNQLEEFRKVRDTIRNKMEDLIKHLTP
jgi:arsenate reductase